MTTPVAVTIAQLPLAQVCPWLQLSTASPSKPHWSGRPATDFTAHMKQPVGGGHNDRCTACDLPGTGANDAVMIMVAVGPH